MLPRWGYLDGWIIKQQKGREKIEIFKDNLGVSTIENKIRKKIVWPVYRRLEQIVVEKSDSIWTTRKENKYYDPPNQGLVGGIMVENNLEV